MYTLESLSSYFTGFRKKAGHYSDLQDLNTLTEFSEKAFYIAISYFHYCFFSTRAKHIQLEEKQQRMKVKTIIILIFCNSLIRILQYSILTGSVEKS